MNTVSTLISDRYVSKVLSNVSATWGTWIRGLYSLTAQTKGDILLHYPLLWEIINMNSYLHTKATAYLYFSKNELHSFAQFTAKRNLNTAFLLIPFETLQSVFKKIKMVNFSHKKYVFQSHTAKNNKSKLSCTCIALNARLLSHKPYLLLHQITSSCSAPRSQSKRPNTSLVQQ